MARNPIESDFKSSKMASLSTIWGYTQYLPLGKYTNSSSWSVIIAMVCIYTDTCEGQHDQGYDSENPPSMCYL